MAQPSDTAGLHQLPGLGRLRLDDSSAHSSSWPGKLTQDDCLNPELQSISSSGRSSSYAPAHEADADADTDSGSENETELQEDAVHGNSTSRITPAGRASAAAEQVPALHDMLESKIAELESLIQSNGDSRADEEERRRGKAQRRQLKEFRAVMESSDGTPEEKLSSTHSKYLQQATEVRQLEKELVALRKKCEQAMREKDAVYSELTKGSAVRQKLESLCRELQRQNKMVLEDSKRIASEEQQKRQELSTKFHSTIKDITTKLEEQGEERLRQMKENETLREKLKHFTQQYEIREQHFAHQLHTKALERQLLDAKLQHQQEHAAQEEAKGRMYGDQIAQLLKTEADLRAQLAVYGDKFEQFQDTLTKSNEVFARFKQEMEKMNKTIKKLEKENVTLKAKCEKSDVSLIELVDERNTQKRQLDTVRAQKDRLEALCRLLQSERKAASAQGGGTGTAAQGPEASTQQNPASDAPPVGDSGSR